MGQAIQSCAAENLEISSLIDEMSEPIKKLNSLAHRIAFEHRTSLQRRLDALEDNAISESDDLSEDDRAFLRAKQELHLLKNRADSFDNNHLFGDPAWMMLLDLYVRTRTELSTTISSACIASCAPPTTALRYLANLVSDGWLVRRMDQADARRVYVDLTPEAMTRLTTLLAMDGRSEGRRRT